jgi:hypothetical protein
MIYTEYQQNRVKKANAEYEKTTGYTADAEALLSVFLKEEQDRVIKKVKKQLDNINKNKFNRIKIQS